ncbi:MAG: hypothetical protein ABI905_14525 [Betaproteobacteria bacterium]
MNSWRLALRSKTFLTVVGAALLVVAATLPAHAGVAGVEGPWSALVAGGVPSGVEDFVPVIVSSLEGETPSRRSVNVAPGKKQIILDTAARSTSRAPSYKRLELAMEPCMRYYVAGRKPSPLSLRWEPIVFRTEAISECAAEFKVAVTEPTTPQPMEKEPAR